MLAAGNHRFMPDRQNGAQVGSRPKSGILVALVTQAGPIINPAPGVLVEEFPRGVRQTARGIQRQSGQDEQCPI
jgi:hypothetical protein